MNLNLTIIPCEETAKYCGDKNVSDITIKEIIMARFHELKIGKITDINITRVQTPYYYDVVYNIKLYLVEWYNTNEAKELKRRIEKKSPQFVPFMDDRYKHSCNIYERCYWYISTISDPDTV